MAPEITSTPPATATVGVPFSYTVTASGMTPLTFAVVSGPQDFMVHATSGVVTWTPQSEGSCPDRDQRDEPRRNATPKRSR